MTRNFTIRDNVIVAAEPNAIYLGRHVEDVSIIGNYISNADNAISNVYGQRIRIVGNRFSRNRKDYKTGPDARDVLYEKNGQAIDGETCVTIRHLTNPTRQCFPF